ncbi:MAG: transposase [Deltaproteobacteria bacterium]|nr:transposase [Deltaproteobacteria bacterium]
MEKDIKVGGLRASKDEEIGNLKVAGCAALSRPTALFLGDRGYARREAIFHVLQGGGQVLVRTNLTNLPLVKESGVPFPLLEHLRTLTGTELGDWDVYVPHANQLIPGRICALKKNKLATEKAIRKAMEGSRKQGYRPRPETLEAAAYTMVFTTLKRDEFKPAKILEMYRGRWQVELVFKRLKSLLGLGHLKKTDGTWLQGKLLVAFLIEALIASAERFFPWGYPLSPETQPMSLERNLAYGSSG